MDSGKQERLVIFDCDIGADDAWALAMLLRAESLSLPDGRRHKVIAITCVQGNSEVENGSLNALRVLKLLDRMDVPVFKGCALPLVPRTWTNTSRYHGSDGFKDVGDYPEVADWQEQLQREHAVNAMYRLVCQHPKQVDFLLCGPLTNFANCINLYDDAFLDKIGGVYMMGGNIYGQGNITKSAEFNFMMDPEAAHSTLERLKEPALILPWEPCCDDDFTPTLDWRLNELGAGMHPFVELLTRVERSILVSRGITKWRNPDAALTAAYLFPKAMILDQSEYYAAVELAGVHTRGQLVLDHLRGRKMDAIHGKKINVRIIRRLNREVFRTIISWTGFHPQASVEELCKRGRPANSQAN
ncbi:inosine-uridine preferring nucleoside hydrolase-like [Drosophila kikkawai]|uniref:Inosine-uridine preferring nucleoside hydrolase-like n=1 Tax=Drosophila kikkawai TaxID=30033 RepID=A0A6P4JN90_DROKI|nr:pyrimidine-specific ribonucleoside hydrolase RihA-like [Drosophila kikkawai]